MKKVTLVCGLPNAGKTTYSKRYKNVIHTDEYSKNYRFDWFRICCKLVLESKGNVCIEGTFGNIPLRKAFLKAIEGHKCDKVCVYITTPVKECMERCKTKPTSVSAKVIEKYSKVFQPPTKNEGWDKIIKVNSK